jgi:putative transposase
MLDYRRNRVPGGTFFFTVNLRDRHSHLLVMQIDLLRQAVRQVRARAPFRIDARVVPPDHMHCLWTLPEGDADFPGRWRAIKIAFAKSLLRDEPRSPGAASAASGHGATGSTRSATIAILRLTSTTPISTPVKHGLVQHPTDWPHSSFHRCVAAGLYPAGWIGSSGAPLETGERQ